LQTFVRPRRRSPKEKECRSADHNDQRHIVLLDGQQLAALDRRN